MPLSESPYAADRAEIQRFNLLVCKLHDGNDKEQLEVIAEIVEQYTDLKEPHNPMFEYTGTEATQVSRFGAQITLTPLVTKADYLCEVGSCSQDPSFGRN